MLIKAQRLLILFVNIHFSRALAVYRVCCQKGTDAGAARLRCNKQHLDIAFAHATEPEKFTGTAFRHTQVNRIKILLKNQGLKLQQIVLGQKVMGCANRGFP